MSEILKIYQPLTNTKMKQRLKITIAVALVGVFITVLAFVAMRLRIPNAHIAFPSALGLTFLTILFLAIRTLSTHEKYARPAKILLRCYYICMAIGLAGFFVMQGLIFSGARPAETEVDAIIVLGAGIRGDMPSVILASRLDATLEYHQTRGDIPIVVTGGIGRGVTLSEAEVMFRYLAARGIDERLILKESESTNTLENIANARVILEQQGFEIDYITVGIVSNEFHLYRAVLIAESAGFNAVGIAAQTPGRAMRAVNFFREGFALAAHLLFRM